MNHPHFPYDHRPGGVHPVIWVMGALAVLWAGFFYLFFV